MDTQTNAQTAQEYSSAREDRGTSQKNVQQKEKKSPDSNTI